jgi:hypothetical protein
MRNPFLPSLLAGVAAAVLFIAVLALGLGFLFLFLPTLPFFWLGLKGNPKSALLASVIAAVLAGGLTHLSLGVFILFALGLPAFYISQLALLSRGAVWFPIGLIWTRLAYYSSAIMVFIVLYYAARGASFEQLVSEYLRAAFSNVEVEYKEAVTTLTRNWLFLIFSMSIWIWGIALYGHAWLVNRLLKNRQKNIRPDFAVTPYLPPNELLFLLGLCAFASLAGSPPLAFLGKTLLVGLLLPYLFLGASLMHQTTQNWPTRRLFLFFIYFMTLAAFWPALILAGMGLIHHIKHLSGRSNSTRS